MLQLLLLACNQMEALKLFSHADRFLIVFIAPHVPCVTGAQVCVSPGQESLPWIEISCLCEKMKVC